MREKISCWALAWFGLVIFGALFPVHCQGTEIFLSPDRNFPSKKPAIFPAIFRIFFWGGPPTAIFSLQTFK